MNTFGKEKFSAELGFFDRRALKRISRLALSLPQTEFSGYNSVGSIEVCGRSSLYRTGFEVVIMAADGSAQITDIDITRSSGNPHDITSLVADRHEEDDYSAIRDMNAAHQEFLLGSKENDLSLWSVMNSTAQAVRAIRYAQRVTADIPNLPIAFP